MKFVFVVKVELASIESGLREVLALLKAAYTVDDALLLAAVYFGPIELAVVLLCDVSFPLRSLQYLLAHNFHESSSFAGTSLR